MTETDTTRQSAGPVPAWIERVPASGNSPAKPPVVFLHGVGGGKAQWPPQLELLAQRGWRAIAWDMPGYGDSAPPDREFTFAELAASLVRMLDALAVERAIVVGHSMGGMVALESYARYPGRFAGLVLACTSAAFGSKDGAFQSRFLEERMAPLEAGLGMDAIAAQQVPKMMTRDAPQSLLEQGIAIMGAVPEATYRASLRCLLTFDRREVLGIIDVPALVLAAAADAQAPPAGMEKMASRIPGAEFVVLPDCAHLANLERPVEFSEAIAEFIERHCSG